MSSPPSSAQIFLKKLRKNIVFRTPLKRHFLFRYEFMQSPAQLVTLCKYFERAKDVPGSILEVGCAYGMTTVFLNRYMDDLQIRKKYYCIDTFSGFTRSDIRVEREQRGKRTDDFSAFQVNDKAWFDETMRLNYLKDVTSFKADAKEFDYALVGPISFCLVDVDIYQPVKVALGKLWEQVSPGGIIIVDDCKQGSNFDGALQAYEEFVNEKSLPRNIEQNVGILEKK